jgi:hypothetical protein
MAAALAPTAGAEEMMLFAAPLSRSLRFASSIAFGPTTPKRPSLSRPAMPPPAACARISWIVCSS